MFENPRGQYPNKVGMILTPTYIPPSIVLPIQKVGICNSYSTVARDLSLKTIPRPRAQPEGERLFSTINPMATVL